MGSGRVRRVLSVAAVTYALFAGGCVSMGLIKPPPPPPPAVEEVTATEKVVYVVPKSPLIQVQPERLVWSDRDRVESLHGVAFQRIGGTSERASEGTVSTWTACESTPGNDNLLACRRMKTYRGNWAGAEDRVAWNKYDVEVAVEEHPEDYTITLTPRRRTWKRDFSVMMKMTPPDFTQEQLADKLAAGVVRVKVELDSPFPPDAVAGNFRRKAAVVDKGLVGVKTPGLDRYRLSEGKEPTDFVVELMPYRTGSKAIVTADVLLAPTDLSPGVRKIDVRKRIDAAVAAFEKIVKD